MSNAISINDFKSKLIPFLCETFLFEGFSPKELSEILDLYEFQIFEFECGEKIYTPSDFSKKVGFVFSGECLVEKEKSGGDAVQLNLLKRCDSFGILTVFSSAVSFPTSVKARKQSTVVFIDGESIVSLIRKYPQIAISVIKFMSNRIEFLNKKVATFSSDTVEEKFARYLLQEFRSDGSVEINLNLSKTAKILNAGRASVYRAINALTELNVISFENKKIYITDLEGLERITQ